MKNFFEDRIINRYKHDYRFNALTNQLFRMITEGSFSLGDLQDCISVVRIKLEEVHREKLLKDEVEAPKEERNYRPPDKECF